MSDRYHSFTVVLEDDIKDEDAEHIITALKMIRGVVAVESNVSDPNSITAYARAKHELSRKLFDAIYSP